MTSTASLPPPPDDPSIGDVLPLGEFLWSLRQRGIATGLRDYRSLERLLLRWPSTDPAMLRDAVAAIVARNEQELADVRAAYDEWFDEKEPAPPPPPPRTRRVPHARTFFAALALVLLIISALGGWKVWRWKHQPTPAHIEQQGPSEKDKTSTLPPPPPLPPEPRGNSLRTPAVAAGITALVILCAAAAWQTRRRRARWKRAYLSETLAGTTGPSRYETTVTRAEPLIDRNLVEDVATIIGQGVEVNEQSDRLDIEQSLRLTLGAGMCPQLAFEAPPRNAAVLILQDTSAEMRPWREKVDAFVAELVKQRVAVERWFFHSDPSTVWSESFGRRVTLERLSGQRGELSLLIISSGDTAGRLIEQHASAGSVLRRWAYRAWLNPVANAAYWPSALWRLPIHVWPFTRNGLRGMAWDLAHTSLAVANDLADAPRAVGEDDIERMKRLIALVPSPTLALADELRRRYAPDIPEEVVLFLAAEGTFRGERYCLPKEETVRLLAAERTDTPSRERRIRHFLLDVLHDSEPAAGSVAHLRWQLDLAMQQMHVSAMGEGSYAEPLTLLGALAEGPLRDEVEAAVGTLRHTPPVERAVRRTLREATERLPSVVPDSVRTLPPRLAWPGWAAIPIAAVIACCSFLAARPAGRGTGEIMHHKVAYQLTSIGNGNYSLTPIGAAPRTTAIYANEQRLTNVHVPGTMSNGISGVYLQARAELPTGQLALSNLVWVPKRVLPPELPKPLDVKPIQPAGEHSTIPPAARTTVPQQLAGTLHLDVATTALPAEMTRVPMTPATIVVRDAASRQIAWNGTDLTLNPGQFSVTSDVGGTVLTVTTVQIHAGHKTSVTVRPDRGVVSLSANASAPASMRLKTPRNGAQLLERGPGHYDLFAPGGTYEIAVSVAGYVPGTVPITVINGAGHKEIFAPDVLFEQSSAALDEKRLVSKTSITYKVEERTAFDLVRPDGSVTSFRKIDGSDTWRESGGAGSSTDHAWESPAHMKDTQGMILKGSQPLFIPNRVTPAGSGIDDKSVYVKVAGKWQPYGSVRDSASK